jgi:hypothetical protein
MTNKTETGDFRAMYFKALEELHTATAKNGILRDELQQLKAMQERVEELEDGLHQIGLLSARDTLCPEPVRSIICTDEADKIRNIIYQLLTKE